MTDDEEVSEVERLDMDDGDLRSMTQSARNLSLQSSSSFPSQVAARGPRFDNRLLTPGEFDDDDDDFMRAGVMNPNLIFEAQHPPSLQLDGTNDTRLKRDSVVSYSDDIHHWEDRSLDPDFTCKVDEAGNLPRDTACQSSFAPFSSSYTPTSISAVSRSYQLGIEAAGAEGISSEDSRTSEFELSDRGSCFSAASETPEAVSSPSTSGGGECLPSTSKKGYKHRHTRQYGLLGDEKKKRFTELNNEASQIYRENKRKRDKESKMRLEDLVTYNEKELERYQLLRQHVVFCRQFHSDYKDFFPEAPEPVFDTDDEN